jgi:Atypical PilZ domain, cyclic di-GMP receptor
VKDPILGDGLVFEDVLPLAWVACAPPDMAQLARLNAENHQFLIADASLEDLRSTEMLKDESLAVVHELQRIEFKVDVLLRMVAALCARNSDLPVAQRVRLSAVGLEWFGAAAPPSGSTGIVEIYVNRTLPQALRLPAIVQNMRAAGETSVAQLHFKGLTDAVVDLVEKLIFRHHRRLVAVSKHSHS